jgi:hypothetical protein
MRRFAVILALGGLLSMFGGALTASPALADTGARPLNLTSVHGQFTSFKCLNALCSRAAVTVDGKATSNLATGDGSFHADLIVDFLGQPAPGGNCNIVDESSTFAFAKGTIFTHSLHEDCATAGLRINTTFTVTGGTGAFQGANGSGREFASVGNFSAIIYQGTISF